MKKFWTVEELAADLVVCRETIRKRIKSGEMKAIKIGGYYRIPAEEVKKFCSPDETE